MLRHVELFDMKLKVVDQASGRTDYKLGKFYLGDTELWKAVGTMEGGAHALVAKVQRHMPGSRVYIDHFVAIDGPPFQRYFNPDIDVASAIAPCSGWMLSSAKGTGCTFFSTERDASSSEMLLNVPTALVRFAASFLSKPCATAEWVLPRMKLYRWPRWRDRMQRIEKAAKHHESRIERRVIFIADYYRKKAAAAIPHICWTIVDPTAFEIRGGARTLRADALTIKLVLLDGEIEVFNHPAAPARAVVLRHAGDSLELTSGAEHGLEVVSSTALWYYEGIQISPGLESLVDPQIGAIVGELKQSSNEWHGSLFRSNAAADALPLALDSLFGAPLAAAPTPALKRTPPNAEFDGKQKTKKKKKKKRRTKKTAHHNGRTDL